ncbi:metalloregulator ArsR/SmtB family transcription factor [Nakamurella sp. YIM 132087]|uniref:Metalloregulator ArsR/SmtB family transcription factor n=1 Tax=Nakamurella alba TaxID=2665158 RepID=A0A7K1FLB0_9ACTN|nr:metalloregulator ArsR/SmtB family transcription factor [Nakamurella alba]MTD14169.1 metalloregulator ArsR/SmtB family transcription factor [Nakamurella alba]
MTEDQLDAVFGALADRTRRAILARLTEGDATVAELAAPFAMSQPAVSRHLKVLEGAGLISRTRQATARLSHLEGGPLQEVTGWLGTYREYWPEAHERLDALLAALNEPSPADIGRPRVRTGRGRPGRTATPIQEEST